ncbi:LPXTG cell wall anchor domain-containing protein [Aeromicrobium fastidiosum]|uniref:LPXTG cell wall anchor domain-containing protein n=1 Tax=Aeromicrobium fastidiosum TaxID=52699 RepID=UPI0020233D88|nr:LPXTG cell wall anchor domain-containing protein [Aeromicrobium fastidiosum]MCL8252110.1 LPXTG cell wall anchor domain-containing protein [Aeromicrobium fastidiosum]
MTNIRLAAVTLLAGVLLMTTGSLAHAADPYPVATPTPTASVAPDGGSGSDDPGSGDAAPDDAGTAPDADRADDNGVLPGTGGASVYILLAAGALLAVGGTLVYSSRRSSAH